MKVVVAHQDLWVKCSLSVGGSSTGVHVGSLAEFLGGIVLFGGVVWWGEVVGFVSRFWWGGIFGSLATREPEQIIEIREFQAEQWCEVWGGSRGGTVREGV